MLLPILTRLNSTNIVLVSASPRRKAILEQIGLQIKQQPSTFAEDFDVDDFPSIPAYVKETALEKASLFQKTPRADRVDLIISADTVVVLDGEVIGKPVNKADAKTTLLKLSGRIHTVITGVALVAFKPRTRGRSPFTERVFHVETEVKFAPLTLGMISQYVNTEEPMGKAGAYAIQGIGASFIESINGDYYNVMGFPIQKFCSEIMDLHAKKLLYYS